MRYIATLAVFGALLCIDCTTLAGPSNSAQVDAVLRRMSLEDKVAELQGIRPNALLVDRKLSQEACRRLIPHGIGQVCQFACSHDLTPLELSQFVHDLQNWIMQATPARVPTLFHEEALSGFPARGATIFPQAIGLACTWDPVLMEMKSRATAESFCIIGARLALAPYIDLCRNPRWGRIEESLGEDPTLTATLGLAFIRGLTGPDLRGGVAATGKHFLAYGAEPASEKSLREEYLFPWEVALQQANLNCVMSAYHTYHGVPCAGSEELLTDILRRQLGFSGLVISDYGAVQKLRGKLHIGEEEAAIQALKAGNDVELSEGVCFPLLFTAVQQGRIPESVVDAAVRRSLLLKAELGLLDGDPVLPVKDPDLDPPEHRAIAYRAACESLVLLRNTGVLPLGPDVRRIALVGPNADNMQALCGDYCYPSMTAWFWGVPLRPEEPHLSTLAAALQAAAVGRLVTVDRGCEWQNAVPVSKVPVVNGDPALTNGMEARRRRMDQLIHNGMSPADQNRALALAREADVVIAAMGENMMLSGEGRDRIDTRLPGQQEAFVEHLIATGKPVVLLLFAGRPLDIARLAPRCAAVVQAWFPGEAGGAAVADVLLGRANPSGKLCVTYPAHPRSREASYKDKDYASDALYAFGMGLSYSRFEYAKLEVAEATAGLAVHFELANTSSRAGDEVAEIYGAPANGSQPQELLGFCRVTLQPGERRVIGLRLPASRLTRWSERGWQPVQGVYRISVGGSSVDATLSAAMTLTRTAIPAARRTAELASEIP